MCVWVSVPVSSLLSAGPIARCLPPGLSFSVVIKEFAQEGANVGAFPGNATPDTPSGAVRFFMA